MKIIDNRYKGNQIEANVFTYEKVELETHCNFYDGKWIITTNIQDHISKLLKLKNNKGIKIYSVDPTGKINSIEVILDCKQIMFCNLKQFSKETREAMRERAKNLNY